MRGCVVAAALVGLLPRDAKAQSMPADSMTHMPAFTEGIPAGWSIPLVRRAHGVHTYCKRL